MARVEPNQGILPSILDRLIDPASGGTRSRPGFTPEQMEDAVLRDLEDLLNTRQQFRMGEIPEAFDQVRDSLYTYGLPDLVSFNVLTPEQRSQIEQMLEAAVARFEPRLRDIRATLLDRKDEHDREVKVHFQARLNMDPAPELAFNTVLELTTGQYSVKRGES
jgi:type VI secretion system protein ImpF